MVRSKGLRPIVDGFLERLDEVVERSADAIWQVVPSYERSGAPLLEDVRHSVRDNVETLARVLSAGRTIKPEELEGIERTGARRAEAGIPLDDVLHAYRTVSRVCWDVLADECRRYEGDALEPAIELAEAVLAYTDAISTSVAEAYARAQRAIVREQEGARREFLADVLYGTDASPEDVLARAHNFGYDLSLSYVALVGCGPPDDARKEATVLAAAAGIASFVSADPIVLQKAEQTIALLPAEPFAEPGVAPYKLVAELGGGWRFGAGGPEPGLEGIRRAYLEAREALEIGTALGLKEPVYVFDDLLLYHFLRIEPPLVERFVRQMLGPLVEYDEKRKGELVKTLEAYFDADASVKLAGEALFAHPHTVTYRLKQIEKLTGWSLREPEDKLRLQLALRAHRLSNVRGRGGREE
ncbi:MAG: helix-turn-helix domain-containing protein [Actinomycetota bacterium]|nr:helix-turn-helix domain-containing protein [Actinomycetota bacterium]